MSKTVTTESQQEIIQLLLEGVDEGSEVLSSLPGVARAYHERFKKDGANSYIGADVLKKTLAKAKRVGTIRVLDKRSSCERCKGPLVTLMLNDRSPGKDELAAFKKQIYAGAGVRLYLSEKLSVTLHGCGINPVPIPPTMDTVSSIFDAADKVLKYQEKNTKRYNRARRAKSK